MTRLVARRREASHVHHLPRLRPKYDVRDWLERRESASQERRGWPGRSPAMTTRELPRAERRGPEQRFLRRGLRAPILRRRFDLAAEFGGGVPAPARVVEHGARQRDHVGLA